jgi:dihydrofolate reductase
MTRRFQVVPAVYVALLRDGTDGPEVLLQLRRGTGFLDGRWAHGAAGHVERGESALQAAARESAEELGVTVDPADLLHVATLHRTVALHTPLEERLDIFTATRTWSGEPTAMEAGRTAGLRWFPLSALPVDTVPHERQALEALAARLRGEATAPSLLARGFDQTLTLVAAVGRNGVIGDGSAMPWHLPEDLRFFKETTLGGTLLMGRGTWDSIGRALPGRRTIVLTRRTDRTFPGAEVAHSLAEALALAGDGEVFVAGGGDVYAQTLPHADRLVLTEVDLAPEGATRFPELDRDEWQEDSRVPGPPPVTAWVSYARKKDRR